MVLRNAEMPHATNCEPLTLLYTQASRPALGRSLGNFRGKRKPRNQYGPNSGTPSVGVDASACVRRGMRPAR